MFVGALKMKTFVESVQKQTMGLILNIQNYQFLTDRRNLSGTRQKSACSKSSSGRFLISAIRNVITKATEYVTFGFYFRILVFFPF